MNIEPKLLTLHQLLKERLFRIPEYQRSYSWRAKQRAELFSDIDKVAATGEPHIMATIVGLSRATKTIITDEFHDIEVVDGQQRLTTLVLLLKAIEGALSIEIEAEDNVARELRQLLVKGDELSMVLLQTNHDASQHCITYLRTGKHEAPGTAKIDADRCLLEAMVECRDFAGRWKAKGKLLELVGILKNRLSFIFHELDKEATVYTVFEVLNSRGLDVSWLDRLKSILMGLAFERKTGTEQDTIVELHRLWREIYREIGLEQGLSTEALRMAATLRSPETQSKLLGEEDAVASLRAIALESPKRIIDVTEWLLDVVRAVGWLHRDPRRDGVTRISQARLLAVAVLTRDDLSKDDQARLLGLWERVSFRIYGMCGNDARTRVGEYTRLARRVVQENTGAAEIEQGLKQIGAGFSIADAVNQLRDTDCYTGWQLELRYLLFRYEEHLAERAGQKFDSEQWARIWEATAAESIEHIMPQSKGDLNQSATAVFVHRLGNLMLLPPRLNSKLQDRDPAKKQDDYVKTGLYQAADVAAQATRWDRDTVVAREDAIIAWAAKEWAD